MATISGVSNPIMARERARAIRRPAENTLENTLGKSLRHHHVIPAVQALRVANNARTDTIKRGINAAGIVAGHPLVPRVAEAIASSNVLQKAPFDARNILKKGLEIHRSYTKQTTPL